MSWEKLASGMEPLSISRTASGPKKGHTVRSISGDLLEYVGTSIDVTERKRADEERERLRQVQADLAHLSRVTTMGELTASLAHEIRQPITAALTNART